MKRYKKLYLKRYQPLLEANKVDKTGGIDSVIDKILKIYKKTNDYNKSVKAILQKDNLKTITVPKFGKVKKEDVQNALLAKSSNKEVQQMQIDNIQDTIDDYDKPQNIQYQDIYISHLKELQKRCKDVPYLKKLIDGFFKDLEKRELEAEKEAEEKAKKESSQYASMEGVFKNLFYKAYVGKEEGDREAIAEARNEMFELADKLGVSTDYLRVKHDEYLPTAEKKYKDEKAKEKKYKVGGKFKLPQNVPDELFRFTGDFSTVRQWEAKILVGNSMASGVNVGDWDSVRYIMFSLKDDTIVPIAISDEHQTGYDVMHEYYNKHYKVKARDYYSLCSWGNHYIYSESDLKECAIVGEKFLKWGGDPKLTIDCRNGVANEITITISDVVKAKGDATKLKGEFDPTKVILPKGKEFLKAWKDLAKKFDAGRKSSSPSIVKQLAKQTIDLVKNLYEFSFKLTFDGEDEIIKILRGMGADGDFGKLENFVFGFSTDEYAQRVNNAMQFEGKFTGIKNTLHNQIRDVTKDPDSYSNRDFINTFGNLDSVIKEFGNL